MAGPASESLGLRLLAVVALVLANAFFVAAEFALVAARRTRIEAMVRRGDRKARTVQAALQDLYRQLSAAQLGITVASILLGYVSEDTVAHLFRDWFAALPPLLDFLARGGVASTAAVAVVSFLHVVFGEQAPKAWAITHAESTSRWVAAPLIFFSWITRPFTDLLNWSAGRVVRLLGLKGTTAGHARSRRRARRHEAPKDPPGDRVGRVRRHGRARHHGGPARGDRRSDLRRVRPAERRAARRAAGRGPRDRRGHAAARREPRVRARARRAGLHHHRRVLVRRDRAAPQGRRPGGGQGRGVRDRGNGRPPRRHGARGAAHRRRRDACR